MKVDIIRKFKWYIVGFILVVIMLSVGLSFCTWDDLSINKALSTAKTGNYSWSTILKDAEGGALTEKPAVGDIVQYGRFWQDNGATDAIGDEEFKPQRWIVVNIDEKNIVTLLSEKVIVYGNFWGKNGEPYTYYQNYYQSTVRSWLNSGKGSLKGSGTGWEDNERYSDNTRSDSFGSIFGISQSNQANKGFLDVAFSDAEKSILVPKRIEGMQGRGINNIPSTIGAYKTTDGRDYINDLVWIPSWQEIYGTKENPWSGTTLYDGTPNAKFSYFDDVVAYSGNEGMRNWVSAKAIAGATDYAYDSNKTNYSNNGAGGHNNGASAKTNTWWWLRSPSPSYYGNSMIVDTGGTGNGAGTYHTYGGVRPAVCVQL